MKLLKVAAGAVNQTPLDWSGNAQRIAEACQQARNAGVQLLCLPELCITGYGCEDAFYSVGMQQTAWQVMQELLPETRGLVVSLGLPLIYGGGIYNVACLAVDGRLVGLVAKQNLAGEGVHYEPRWFKAWPSGVVADYESNDGGCLPIGDLIFDVGGIRVAFEICEDAWVAHRPGGAQALAAVDMILNPSASHFAFDKQEIRRRFVLEGSRAFGVTYIYANLLGNESGRVIFDGGTMIAAGGFMIREGERFLFEDVRITSSVVDVEHTRMRRASTGSYKPNINGAKDRTVRVGFDWVEHDPQPLEPQPIGWEKSADLKQEEFTRALSLGLFDYLRKSFSKGFVISLSGGADSAAVATLSALAIRRAFEELGPEKFVAKVGHLLPQLPEEPADLDIEDAVSGMVACVYQATRNSGDVTKNAAKGLADALGCTFYYFDLDRVVEGYKEIVADALGRELTWETDDIALQNIQARGRSPSAWMLANINSFLLLATSNRSEAAVGYATMDGDTSGGLSPIAGIDKAFLRHWLRWMENVGPKGGQPIAALGAINSQQPTAELRPQESKQTDEKDLMPYDLLDAIERAAIRDKLLPLDVYKLMKVRYNYPTQQLAKWIEKFFLLWCRNQWKRERYAPSFHLDDENLDPKTWCRFPILSGGFRRELGEMWQYVNTAEAES